MGKQYSIIKRDYFSGVNQYLEVHIRNTEDMSDLQGKLEKLSSVKKANPNKEYFIVYVREPHTIMELENEVDSLLRKYYDNDLSDGLHLTGKSLGRFGKAKIVFAKAYEQYGTKDNIRECLDNLRLSLELMLKEILQNNKSLENQREQMSLYLRQKGVSSEFVTLFWRVLDCFCKYQNNHVKHNIDIAEKDIPIIMEQTKALINTIIRLEGK